MLFCYERANKLFISVSKAMEGPLISNTLWKSY